MNAFPRLKTGAVAQYPAGRALSYATEVLKFVDGTDQRYRKRGAPVRRWLIRLDLLDETELARLEEFFAAAQGRLGSFSFEDPWTGNVHTDCSLENDEFEVELLGETRGRTVLVVRENA
ncbi:MAG TPA: DUF2460 domain-containing protein [Bryobacteraceae bacterium]|nr:DUF2460 domain-containing protein [Bryobacteraceae bacterium]HOL70054.1 DUF2460 domain-containing protein [Bryobacteraceae bacterium]HOQ46200.1 DUF2460 domain-containing protein [Bryobacteraceae bacterium]HPQ16788.1 DUF2460 domain-containing protein [Bryobacteraceae bacterium]HPU74017.1 DUF2460 domain-containing protein [Bryobacteraceae bacterium]